ncbi:MAG: 16S rRNA (uracil(1498)-N(3))-methyltransferase [Cyanobacteria bacterium P01_E01_bin.34]
MVLPEHPQSLKHLPRLAFASGSIAASVERKEYSVPLTTAQRHYLERVRRLRLGDRFLAFDCSGRLWQATLSHAQAVIGAELEPLTRELPIRLELAIAVPKGSGFDSLVRQLTELGVSSIVPLTSERTISVPSANKLQRWRAIAVEAAEQCERVAIPEIAEPTRWQTWLQSPQPKETTRFVAAARAGGPHLMTLLNRLTTGQGLSIAVGPEGGWTEAELTWADEAEVRSVGLGNRILRTVTAPLAIASLVAGYSDCLDTDRNFQ